MSIPRWTSRAAPIVAPARRLDVAVERIDDQAVVTEPRGGNTYHLNETAYEVWQCCDGATTTRRIAAAVTARWTVEFDNALDDVEQLVVFLAEAGLIGAGEPV